MNEEPDRRALEPLEAQAPSPDPAGALVEPGAVEDLPSYELTESLDAIDEGMAPYRTLLRLLALAVVVMIANVVLASEVATYELGYILAWVGGIVLFGAVAALPMILKLRALREQRDRLLLEGEAGGEEVEEREEGA